MTWANQLRMLVQQFEQLGSVVGGTLVNAFKPLITVLNNVMQKVISFAKTVANALGAIFGWTIQIDSGGMANDFEAAGTAAEDMADGTGDAAKNAKKLSKYIAAWHEVNNMTTDDSNKKGSGSGGGAGDLGDLSGYQANLVKTDGLLQKYESEIDTLRKLGKYIGDTLSDTMESINWDAVYEKARNFGTGLADFLNGLFVDTSLFSSLGKTIAGSLNTALHFLDSFGEKFEWKNFGKSIAKGINAFFKKFDFELLSKTLNVWAKGILDAAISAVSNTNWLLIGKEIGTFLEGIDFLEIGKKVGKLLWEAINSGISIWSGMFSIAPIETTILSVVAALYISESVIKNLNAAKNALANIQAGLSNLASAALAHPILAIGAAILVLANAVYVMEKNWKNEMAEQYSEFISNMAPGTEKIKEHTEELKRFAQTTGELEAKASGEAASLDILKEKYLELADKANLTNEEQNLLKYYAEELIKSVPKLANVIDKTTGKYSGQREELIKLVDAQKEYQLAIAYGEMLSDYNKKLAEATINLKQVNAERQKLTTEYSNMLSVQETAISQYWSEAKLVEETGMTYSELAKKISFTEQAINDNRSAYVEYKDALSDVKESIGYVEEELSKSQTAYAKTQEAIDAMDFSKMSVDAINAIDELHGIWGSDGVQILGQDAVKIYEEIQNGLNPGDDGYYTLASGQMVRYGEGLTDNVSNAVSTLTDEMLDEINHTLAPQGKAAFYENGKLFIGELVSGSNSVKKDLNNAFSGYAAYSAEGFKNRMEEISRKTMPSVMSDFAKNGIMNPFTKTMGINSPSRVFQQYGAYTVEGFNNGISSSQQSTHGVIRTWVDKISGWFTDLLDIHSPSKLFSEYGLFTVEGFNSGISDNERASYAVVGGWANGISDVFNKKLDLSVPDTDFTPKMNFDSGKLSTTMHDEIDVKMAEYSYQMRQLQQSIETQNQILEEMNAKGLVFDDNAMVKKYQTAATKFRRQTGRQLGIAY